MLLNLLSQGNQRLVYFRDISRGVFDQLIQMAKLEKPAWFDTQELSESCAICFDADAL